MAISLGGGGSASQVNETIDINSAENLITLEDGRVYLKGGVTSTDLTTYPDATTTLAYSGFTFSVGAQDGEPQGVTSDGTYLWVLGSNNNSVFKYSMAGVYQNVSFSVGSQTGGNIDDVMWDGSHFWVVSNSNDAVYKYNASGVYQNVSFSVASQMGVPRGIAWDGTYFYIVDQTNDRAYKYNAGGTYQNVSFVVADSPQGIAYDGSHLWVISVTTQKLHQYTTAGVATGLEISTAGLGSNPSGLGNDGTTLYTTDRIIDNVFKFQNQIGVGSQGGTEYGNQNYMRIK
jgi:hypothetical protein